MTGRTADTTADRRGSEGNVLLIDHARGVIGLPMRGKHGRHIGWTVDAAKRDAFVKAGGQSTTVTDSGRVLGYEVTCLVGAKVEPRPAGVASEEKP